MDIKLYFALLVGKTVAALIKLKGGGGTAAPGLYALKIDPNLVKKLSNKVKYGSIIISGTNGKTTTARLISDILSTKFNVIHNRQGSNLLRGIASTFIAHSSVFGNLKKNFAVWEVDEATLPEAIQNLSPNTVVLLNLFRDQLDRYGEVDTTRKKWQRALSSLPKNTTLILNADDPGLSILKKFFQGKAFSFGVGDKEIKLPRIESVADVKHCLNCGASLVLETVLTGHLGHWRCSKCDYSRPKPETIASNLIFNKKDLSTSLKLSVHNSQFTVKYQLPGLYNVYNILAAASACYLQKIDTTLIVEKIKSFSSVFGRFQKIKINGKEVIVLLVKNPAGANEVLRTISQIPNLNLLTILNDNIADGKDVSWIWDTNWEILSKKVKQVNVSGTRSWDLANRLKYAEFKLSKNNISKDINYSIKASIAGMSNKDTLVVLPTYTALLSVQGSLNQLERQITKWHKQ